MKAGDFVGNYRLLEDFRVVGAGLSEWTFAEREGRAFFIKRFLSPTYPEDDAPGSAATKERKRAQCAAFEAHQRGIKAALAPVTRYGGNLIATLDFFRSGAKYYKVTEKVELSGLETGDVARMTYAAKLVLLKTVAHSLKILHDLRIVHSDLKPSNVLIKRTERGYTTKLIDFDSSYIEGNAPPPDQIVGTMNYYSPELVRYIQGAGSGSELTCASDIFALGLIYCEYLTGSLPTFERAHREAAIAVLNGVSLRLTTKDAPAGVVDVVNRMLLLEPADRPSIGEIHRTLMGTDTGPPTTAGRPLRPVAAPASHAIASALRGKGVRLARSTGAAAPQNVAPEAAEPSGPTVPPPRERTVSDTATVSGVPAAGPNGLLGKLLHKIEERRTR